MSEFNFNISLSVLNDLGRNLYRNFITIIGEAISNSWDADAKNCLISIDKENKTMIIQDDGIGMTEDDFQNKFLKIGYSKRKNDTYLSGLGRPFIGRKGIGKLALLSCAKKISIITKTASSEIIGGTIDNTELDYAITDDLNPQEYKLQAVPTDIKDKFNGHNNGTMIFFENIIDDIYNTLGYIKKAIALYFKFSLMDEDFTISVNDEIITCKMLNELAGKTEYIWNINNFSEPFLDPTESAINPKKIIKITTELPLKGYIATVEKPADIKIKGTNEKVTLDLFVNGRLRERDLLKHIPTARIVESYTFGQIYCDYLDVGTNKDIFTSSREGVVANDENFKQIISTLQNIYSQVIKEWDDYRRSDGSDGDPDNTSLKPKERKAEELFNQTIKEMDISKRKKTKKDNNDFDNPIPKWINILSKEAKFNIPSYAECFISENLLRYYIKYTKTPLSSEAIKEAEKWKKKEQDSKNAANIFYDIRQSIEDIFYLDMDNLANLVDKAPSDKPKSAGLSRSATNYKPLRNSVGHTSLLTDFAKQQLTLEYINIQARLVQLLKKLKEQDEKKH